MRFNILSFPAATIFSNIHASRPFIFSATFKPRGSNPNAVASTVCCVTDAANHNSRVNTVRLIVGKSTVCELRLLSNANRSSIRISQLVTSFLFYLYLHADSCLGCSSRMTKVFQSESRVLVLYTVQYRKSTVF